MVAEIKKNKGQVFAKKYKLSNRRYSQQTVTGTAALAVGFSKPPQKRSAVGFVAAVDPTFTPLRNKR